MFHIFNLEMQPHFKYLLFKTFLMVKKVPKLDEACSPKPCSKVTRHPKILTSHKWEICIWKSWGFFPSLPHISFSRGECVYASLAFNYSQLVFPLFFSSLVTSPRLRLGHLICPSVPMWGAKRKMPEVLIFIVVTSWNY